MGQMGNNGPNGQQWTKWAIMGQYEWKSNYRPYFTHCFYTGNVDNFFFIDLQENYSYVYSKSVLQLHYIHIIYIKYFKCITYAKRINSLYNIINYMHFYELLFRTHNLCNNIIATNICMYVYIYPNTENKIKLFIFGSKSTNKLLERCFHESLFNTYYKHVLFVRHGILSQLL